MRVMLVTPYYYPKIGGLENYARQLGLSMRETNGIEIVVVTSNHLGRRTVKEIIDGVTVYRLGTWVRLSNTPINPLWPLMIRRIMKQERPDIIHAHTPVPSMADAASWAAGRTPLVITYHAATVLKDGQPIFNTLARAYQIYERFTLRKAAKIIAVSNFVQQQLGNRYAHKTLVIPNAIWAHEIETRVQPKRPSFIFVGSLDRTHSWKGLEDIIRAIGQYRQLYGDEVHLTVIGDGDRRLEYEAMVSDQELEANITFVGAQTGKQKDNYFRAASAVVCYPTTSNDAFPTVFLEAWAKAVPVVAARIGAIPSLISDEVDGFLAEPRSPQALAHVLHRVMSSQKLRAQVASSAQKRTKAHYTWERQGLAMAACLEQLQ